MKQRTWVLILLLASQCVFAQGNSEPFLSWTEQQALKIGESMRATGRVGGFWDSRIRHTEQSYNYKLRATWLTPEVIRAAARLSQLRDRLSVDRTLALVTEAEAAGDTVVLVEIDPREGSGVIPIDWQCFLEPAGLPGGAAHPVTGVSSPRLRNVKALAGIAQRDYDYDVFWMVFRLFDEKGDSIFPESAVQAELVVRIGEKEGRVSWAIPASIRARISALQAAAGK
jgi:hypothetical protein